MVGDVKLAADILDRSAHSTGEVHREENRFM